MGVNMVDMAATTGRDLLMPRLAPTMAGVDMVATMGRDLLMPRLPPTMAGVDMAATTGRDLLMLRLHPTTAGVDMAATMERDLLKLPLTTAGGDMVDMVTGGASNFNSHAANSPQTVSATE